MKSALIHDNYSNNLQLLEAQQQQTQMPDHLKCGEVYTWLCAGELYAVECRLCEDRPLCPLSEFPQHMEVWHTDWQDPTENVEGDTDYEEDSQDHSDHADNDNDLSFATEDSGLFESEDQLQNERSTNPEEQQDILEILEPFEQVLIEQEDNSLDSIQISEDVNDDDVNNEDTNEQVEAAVAAEANQSQIENKNKHNAKQRQYDVNKTFKSSNKEQQVLKQEITENERELCNLKEIEERGQIFIVYETDLIQNQQRDTKFNKKQEDFQKGLNKNKNFEISLKTKKSNNENLKSFKENKNTKEEIEEKCLELPEKLKKSSKITEGVKENLIKIHKIKRTLNKIVKEIKNIQESNKIETTENETSDLELNKNYKNLKMLKTNYSKHIKNIQKLEKHKSSLRIFKSINKRERRQINETLSENEAEHNKTKKESSDAERKSKEIEKESNGIEKKTKETEEETSESDNETEQSKTLKEISESEKEFNETKEKINKIKWDTKETVKEKIITRTCAIETERSETECESETVETVQKLRIGEEANKSESYKNERQLKEIENKTIPAKSKICVNKRQSKVLKNNTNNIEEINIINDSSQISENIPKTFIPNKHFIKNFKVNSKTFPEMPEYRKENKINENEANTNSFSEYETSENETESNFKKEKSPYKTKLNSRVKTSGKRSNQCQISEIETEKEEIETSKAKFKDTPIENETYKKEITKSKQKTYKNETKEFKLGENKSKIETSLDRNKAEKEITENKRNLSNNKINVETNKTVLKNEQKRIETKTKQTESVIEKNKVEQSGNETDQSKNEKETKESVKETNDIDRKIKIQRKETVEKSLDKFDLELSEKVTGISENKTIYLRTCEINNTIVDICKEQSTAHLKVSTEQHENKTESKGNKILDRKSKENMKQHSENQSEMRENETSETNTNEIIDIFSSCNTRISEIQESKRNFKKLKVYKIGKSENGINILKNTKITENVPPNSNSFKQISPNLRKPRKSLRNLVKKIKSKQNEEELERINKNETNKRKFARNLRAKRIRKQEKMKQQEFSDSETDEIQKFSLTTPEQNSLQADSEIENLNATPSKSVKYISIPLSVSTRASLRSYKRKCKGNAINSNFYTSKYSLFSAKKVKRVSSSDTLDNETFTSSIHSDLSQEFSDCSELKGNSLNTKKFRSQDSNTPVKKTKKEILSETTEDEDRDPVNFGLNKLRKSCLDTFTGRSHIKRSKRNVKGNIAKAKEIVSNNNESLKARINERETNFQDVEKTNKNIKQTLVTSYFGSKDHKHDKEHHPNEENLANSMNKKQLLQTSEKSRDTKQDSNSSLFNSTSSEQLNFQGCFAFKDTSSSFISESLSPISPKTEEEHFEFYEPKEKLNKHHISHLIKLYQEHPRLWDQSHPDFCEPQVCRKSWQQITEQWNKFCKRKFTIAEVRIRICTLCQRYVQERERLALEGELDEYAKFPYYEQMKFLEQQKSLQKRRELYEQQNEKILKIFQNFPVLWHVSCYKSRQAKERAQAFESISKTLKLSGLHLSPVGVQKRIRSLRKCYRLEKIRFLHAQVERIPFDSEFRHYKRMQFMNKHIDPFVCRICGKIFENLQGFREHLEAENHGSILQEESENEYDMHDKVKGENENIEITAEENVEISSPFIDDSETIVFSPISSPSECILESENSRDILQAFTAITSTPNPALYTETPEKSSFTIQEVLQFPSNTPQEPIINSLNLHDHLIEEIMENVTNNDSFTKQSLDQFIDSVTTCDTLFADNCVIEQAFHTENSFVVEHPDIVADETCSELGTKQNMVSLSPVVMHMENSFVVEHSDIETEETLSNLRPKPHADGTYASKYAQIISDPEIIADPIVSDQSVFGKDSVKASDPVIVTDSILENDSVIATQHVSEVLSTQPSSTENISLKELENELNSQHDEGNLPSFTSLVGKVQCNDTSIKLNTEFPETSNPNLNESDNENYSSAEICTIPLPDHLIHKMIELYRKYPQIWNPNHLDYNSRTLRRQAWCSLTKEYNSTVGKQLSWRTLHRKLTDYAKYYKKLITEQKHYEQQENKWTFYEDFKFMDDVITVNDELQRSVHHRDNNFKIIAIYKTLPQLWDIKQVDYNKRSIKQRNIELMCNLLQEEHNLQLTTERLKNRLIELRTQYRSAKKQRLKCEKTQQRFSSSEFEFYEALNFLDNHIDPFICDKCKMEFKKLTDFNQHLKKEHSTKSHLKNGPLSLLPRNPDVENICHICGIKFTTRSNLLHHIKRHEGIRNYECTICSKRFYASHSLKVHIRSHTKECPYTCEKCGISFVSASKLNQHVKRHLNKKDFPCDFCPKAFFTAFEKHRHERRHLNIRDKACPICGKTFVAGSSYYAHLMLHNDKKRFECDKCEMKFAQYAGLYKHKKRHHS